MVLNQACRRLPLLLRAGTTISFLATAPRRPSHPCFVGRRILVRPFSPALASFYCGLVFPDPLPSNYLLVEFSTAHFRAVSALDSFGRSVRLSSLLILPSFLQRYEPFRRYAVCWSPGRSASPQWTSLKLLRSPATFSPSELDDCPFAGCGSRRRAEPGYSHAGRAWLPPIRSWPSRRYRRPSYEPLGFSPLHGSFGVISRVAVRASGRAKAGSFNKYGGFEKAVEIAQIARRITR